MEQKVKKMRMKTIPESEYRYYLITIKRLRERLGVMLSLAVESERLRAEGTRYGQKLLSILKKSKSKKI